MLLNILYSPTLMCVNIISICWTEDELNNKHKGEKVEDNK